MKKINKIFLSILFVLPSVTVFSQFTPGRWAVGGEFSFVNSRSDYSTTNTSFSSGTSSGLNSKIYAGQFLTEKSYLHAILNFDITKVKNNFESTVGGLEVRSSLSNIYTFGAGAGWRRYFPANKTLGFFVQGQATISRTWVINEVYFEHNDTVTQETRTSQQFNSLRLNINPGAYVNVGKHWQFTLNLGSLYYIQTWYPKGQDLYGTRTSAFGMDVNIFDFKLGVLYLIGKTPVIIENK